MVAQRDAPTRQVRQVRFLANRHTVRTVKPLRGLVGAAMPLSDAAGGVCGLVRAGSAGAVASVPLRASPVQAGELKGPYGHPQAALELATQQETGRRGAKIAQGLLLLFLQERQLAPAKRRWWMVQSAWRQVV